MRTLQWLFSLLVAGWAFAFADAVVSSRFRSHTHVESIAMESAAPPAAAAAAPAAAAVATTTAAAAAAADDNTDDGDAQPVVIAAPPPEQTEVHADTKGASAESMDLEAARYTIKPGMHCRGKSIWKWADGSEAHYGRTDLIPHECKALCDQHDECVAFVYRHNDTGCFWKRNPKPKKWTKNEVGHDCFLKVPTNTSNQVSPAAAHHFAEELEDNDVEDVDYDTDYNEADRKMPWKWTVPDENDTEEETEQKMKYEALEDRCTAIMRELNRLKEMKYEGRIAEAESKVAAETSTPHLSAMIANMWRDMHSFASPFYIKYLKEQLELAEAEQAKIRQKLQEAEGIEASAGETETASKGQKSSLTAGTTLIFLIVVAILAICALAFFFRAEHLSERT